MLVSFVAGMEWNGYELRPRTPEAGVFFSLFRFSTQESRK